jgi:hypothetical protein
MSESDKQNGWNEYSRLVLKELETLANTIKALNSENGKIKLMKLHHLHR